MSNLPNLVRYNLHHLHQAQHLIERLSDGAFLYVEPPLFESAIGEHVRHILEHYACFLDGIKTQRVDYDARNRDSRVSSDRKHALKYCDALCQSLEAVRVPGQRLIIKMAGSVKKDDSSVWTESNIERELQYLQAHTIHHFALISMILRIQGLDLDAEFGVAPSTLRHRASVVAQAEST